MVTRADQAIAHQTDEFQRASGMLVVTRASKGSSGSGLGHSDENHTTTTVTLLRLELRTTGTAQQLAAGRRASIFHGRKVLFCIQTEVARLRKI